MESDSIAHTLVTKSDQLNADDIVGGPITVQITGVTLIDSKEQPVIIALGGGHRPWKPCLTMRKLLAFAWGERFTPWIGRWVTLYRDPTATWANVEVGGIRVQAMSDIPKPFTVALNEKKGKKKPITVAVLTPPKETQGHQRAPYTLATWKQALTAAGHDPEKVVAWLGTLGANASEFVQREYVAVLSDLALTGPRRAEYDAYLAR